jgi:PIN domain nuclease of toxin-antitoxin system
VKLLLDTHAFFWAIVEPERLSDAARSAIEAETAEVYVSVASAWEMAIKVGNGKWPEASELVDTFAKSLVVPGFRLLPMSLVHTRTAGLMTSAHRDPFDRLLVAQAQIEGLSLVSSDSKLSGMGAEIVW